ncbi:hypothetical protein LEP1GSC052_2730 [Leptospira kmetyi serovar Malaysia str. Bejo-Iso9]|nr:hypothetical protein LEP1GSC052_2730 [Leptospira kmetyi serovar Malaysia str. Bejo-Iso9]
MLKIKQRIYFLNRKNRIELEIFFQDFLRRISDDLTRKERTRKNQSI